MFYQTIFCCIECKFLTEICKNMRYKFQCVTKSGNLGDFSFRYNFFRNFSSIGSTDFLVKLTPIFSNVAPFSVQVNNYLHPSIVPKWPQIYARSIRQICKFKKKIFFWYFRAKIKKCRLVDDEKIVFRSI